MRVVAALLGLVLSWRRCRGRKIRFLATRGDVVANERADMLHLRMRGYGSENDFQVSHGDTDASS